MALTLQQYRDGAKSLLGKIGPKIIESVVVPAASRLLANIINRINDGENSAGGKIGHYSSNPFYATREQFVKKSAFKGQGKDGFKGEKIVSENVFKVTKKTLKNGKVQERLTSEKKFKVVKNTPKSMYLAGGYRQLREIQGRRTDVMNFNYSGDLLASYRMQKDGQYVLLGLISETEKRKREWLEKRFGKVFPATTQEIDAYNKEVTDGAAAAAVSILKG